MGNFDFGGWATRNDLLCGDGRTIRKNAFKENDGCEVPLIWNHEHNDPNAVLGHAVLENRDDGVYAYGVFNDTAIRPISVIIPVLVTIAVTRPFVIAEPLNKVFT